jgi:hypothetical protein
MLDVLTFLKVTKMLVASSLFHHSASNLSGSNKPHFYDDPVPGDSFPPNIFHSDDGRGGGSHVGTYRDL